MQVRTFPSGNFYFNAGISACLDEDIPQKADKERIVIVCMASWSIRDVFFASWLKTWSQSKVLIVSDKRFLPLAKYYQVKNKNIIDVCHTSDFYNELRFFVSRGSFNRTKKNCNIPHLTDMEYFSILNALNGTSVGKQALTMGLSTKTVFSHRATSAKKLNVKKLSHLLSPKILNSTGSVR